MLQHLESGAVHRSNHYASIKRLVQRFLRSIADDFDAVGDFLAARSYYDEAALWHRSLGDRGNAASCTVAQAETWIKEADGHRGSAIGIVGLNYFQQAIELFREVPRSERLAHQVDQRIATLEQRLTAAGQLALGEMRTIRSPGMDVTEFRVAAQAAVRGQSLGGALIRLVRDIYPGANSARLRENAEATLRANPLQALFGGIHLNREGRIIATQPAGQFGVVSGEARDPMIWGQMLREYRSAVDIVVQAQLYPALEVIQLEHRVREDDCIDFARRSPIVSPGREGLVGRAIHAGFDDKFDVALNLLTPQIEHITRTQLKFVGVTTTSRDHEGVADEIGLSALIKRPEMESIFGADLTFELEALFCDALGPNLRNEVAHGLLDDLGSNSTSAVYAWWFLLKIVIAPLLPKVATPEVRALPRRHRLQKRPKTTRHGPVRSDNPQATRQ